MNIPWSLLQNAVELGIIYGLVALALFLTYSMLNVCDLSTDGCFTMGAATGAVVALAGHPFLAFFAAMGMGILSGFVNAFLQTKMKVASMLAGIIVNTGLFTVNYQIMGKTNVSLNGLSGSAFSIMKDATKDTVLSGYSKLLVVGAFIVIVSVLVGLFLKTRLGLSIRATGDNMSMVKSSSINPAFTTTIGLCIGGAMTALSGCLFTEYQKVADINMGIGMVTKALASLIIGETIFGKKSIPVRIIGVIFGSCLYQIIVAIALDMKVPSTALYIVSALIVAVAISLPAIREIIELQKTKRAAMRKHKELYGSKGGR